MLLAKATIKAAFLQGVKIQYQDDLTEVFKLFDCLLLFLEFCIYAYVGRYYMHKML